MSTPPTAPPGATAREIAAAAKQMVVEAFISGIHDLDGNGPTEIDKLCATFTAALLAAHAAGLAEGAAAACDMLKRKLDYHLNEHLCLMEPGFDDSITGFNSAWDVMNAVFKVMLSEIAAAIRTPPATAAQD